MRQSKFTDQELMDMRKELQVYLDWFSDQLGYVMARMPVRGIVKNDGTFEFLPPAPEWQKLIDEITKTQNEILKTRFPDFYANI